MAAWVYSTNSLVSKCKDLMTERAKTYAKEKFSTFGIAATGAAVVVIFVYGVAARVSCPNQSMASTEA